MSIEARLARLERHNSILRTTVALMLVAGVCFSLLGQVAPAVPGVIEARAIHVVGDDGRPLVTIEGFRPFANIELPAELKQQIGNTQLGCIRLLSEMGRDSVVVTATPRIGDVGGIRLLNNAGETSIEMKSTPGVGGRIVVGNRDARPAVEICCDHIDGTTGRLHLMDGTGKRMLEAGSVFGWGTLHLGTTWGTSPVQISATQGITLRGRTDDGTEGGILQLQALSDWASIRAFDRSANTVFEIRGTPEGDGVLSLGSTARAVAGKTTWQLRPQP